MKLRIISLALCLLMVLLVLFGCTRSEAGEANPFEGRFGMAEIGGGWHVIVDKQTGVCYLQYDRYKYGAAITVLVDEDGYPVLWEEESK